MRLMTKHAGLEICCGDIHSVAAARKGGAERIELCCGLSDGGLTPSEGIIAFAAASGIGEINVLIRPRPGDFLYDHEETLLMEHDIRTAVGAGATGVVIGALTADGDIDMEVCRRLSDAARNAGERLGRKVNLTFHRAFDVSRNAERSINDIAALGCDCLLTSGMAASADKGIPNLRDAVRLAAGRFTVMAGSGVNPGNAAEILSQTGVGALHATARRPHESGMKFRRSGVPMGAPGSDEYMMPVTAPDIVARLLEITRNHTIR